jgi:hypothetical protein
VLIAHHLRYADFVISLNENGHLIEQGSYDALVAGHGYVGMLASKITSVVTTRAPELVLDDETLQGLNLEKEDDIDSTSRGTSDLAVYLYYFQNIGWPLLTLFFACACLFDFGLMAPRKWYFRLRGIAHH